MAFVQKKLFSTFCQEIGLGVEFPGKDACPASGVLLSITSGKAGHVRNSDSLVHQLVRWASARSNMLVEWDLGIPGSFGYDVLLSQRKVLSGKPTDCTMDPGDAFLLDRGLCNFTDSKHPRPILPDKAEDGSYAYFVPIDKLLFPEEWVEQARECGFMVRTTHDKKSYYGSRFPGGEQNFSPPIGLIPWIRLAQERRLYTPRPAIAKSSNEFPMLGYKLAGRIPNYGSCRELKMAANSRVPGEVQAVLTNVPPEVCVLASNADAERKRIVLDEMCEFIRNRKINGSAVYFSGLLKEMKDISRTEQEYCSMIEAFDRLVKVDWALNAKVSLRDQGEDLN